MEIESLLKQLFKDKEIKVISRFHGGMMNQSYLVLINNKKHVLYLPTPQANEMVNRREEMLNHERVNKLGLTYKNIYFDVEKGIKINEYVPGNSLNQISQYNFEKIAKLLQNLHKSPEISEIDYCPFDRLIAFEKEREMLTDYLDIHYLTLRNVVFDNIDFLKKDKLVLSHNDFQKSNIIQTPEDEYFMIDFEFMMNNSPYYDIACFANDNVSEGEKLLKCYFPNLSTDDFKKFYLWRIFISLQWHNVAIIKHYRGEGEKHHIDFQGVANHFISNALEAYNKLNLLK